jgi:hypothetical protein
VAGQHVLDDVLLRRSELGEAEAVVEDLVERVVGHPSSFSRVRQVRRGGIVAIQARAQRRWTADISRSTESRIASAARSDRGAGRHGAAGTDDIAQALADLELPVEPSEPQHLAQLRPDAAEDEFAKAVGHDRPRLRQETDEGAGRVFDALEGDHGSAAQRQGLEVRDELPPDGVQRERVSQPIAVEADDEPITTLTKFQQRCHASPVSGRSRAERPGVMCNSMQCSAIPWSRPIMHATADGADKWGQSRTGSPSSSISGGV